MADNWQPYARFNTKPTKMILDLDTGIDDAMALTYALGADVEVIGVTGTYGNVLVETGCHNVLSLLDLYGNADIPVLSGETHALAKDSFEVLEISAFVHGKNGLGEVDFAHTTRQPQPGAVQFLIDQVNQHGDDLVIVATGAWTNIAHAIKQDPEFAKKARVVLMGGALTVPGNVSAWQEANVSQDPEAADLVLRNLEGAVMVGLDVTLQTVLQRSHTAQWREQGTEFGRVLADATDYYIGVYDQLSPYLGGCGLHDPLAVAVALDPSLVTFLPINMKCDVEGPTRGRTIGNEEEIRQPHRRTQVAVAVDAPRFVENFMATTLKAINAAKH